MQRFGPSPYENPQGALTKLTQTTSVLNYKTEFEELKNKVPGLDPTFVTNMFISDLQPHIQSQVMIHEPKELDRAFAIARMFEAQHLKYHKPPPSQYKPTPDYNSKPQTWLPTSTNKTRHNTQNNLLKN
ncbi:hypothetical protein KSP39_PZI015879 [Platanthera zijinensis]|uniref:Gag protein n=1 Tax=Platanthera zijinensis TaxID=2320716 RepID=A0AAP0B9Q6_9ASPA